MRDVKTRWEQLHDSMPALRLYALVDGVQYQTQLCKRLQPGHGLLALFAGTQDVALAHAGPWLVDVTLASKKIVSELARLERDVPSLTWLITAQDLDDLGQLLQERLDVKLPDGRSALLRFWDPRVLINLTRTFDDAQHEEFFGSINEWHLLDEGQRVQIRRQDVDVH